METLGASDRQQAQDVMHALNPEIVNDAAIGGVVYACTNVIGTRFSYGLKVPTPSPTPQDSPAIYIDTK